MWYKVRGKDEGETPTKGHMVFPQQEMNHCDADSRKTVIVLGMYVYNCSLLT